MNIDLKLRSEIQKSKIITLNTLITSLKRKIKQITDEEYDKKKKE